jgi:hypothetical protein
MNGEITHAGDVSATLGPHIKKAAISDGRRT